MASRKAKFAADVEEYMAFRSIRRLQVTIFKCHEYDAVDAVLPATLQVSRLKVREIMITLHIILLVLVLFCSAILYMGDTTAHHIIFAMLLSLHYI